jgi:hypothetical protein
LNGSQTAAFHLNVHRYNRIVEGKKWPMRF